MSKSREELTKEFAKNIEKIKELQDWEEMVVDNKIEFEYGDKVYRVRKPTYKELKEIEKEKVKKQMQLMSERDENGNPVYLFEEELKKKYQEMGVDLYAIEKEIRLIESQIEDLMLTLAVTKNDVEREKLKEKILELREQQAELSIKKSDYLAISLEAQIHEFSIAYTTYKVLEVKEGEEWRRVFDTFEDFSNCEDLELIMRAIYFVTNLMLL